MEYAGNSTDLVLQAVNSEPMYSDLPLWSLIEDNNRRGKLSTRVEILDSATSDDGMGQYGNDEETSPDDVEELLPNNDEVPSDDDEVLSDDDEVLSDNDEDILSDDGLGPSREVDLSQNITETRNGEDFSLVGGSVSQEDKTRIVQRNAVIWDKYDRPHVVLYSLGQTCIGPQSKCQDTITKGCPEEKIIDLDSALFRKYQKNQLLLNVRCIACDIDFQTNNLLAKAGIEHQFEEGIDCRSPGCVLRSFRQSGRCVGHLRELVSSSTFILTKSTIIPNLKRYEAIFLSSSRKQWTFPPEYNTVLRRINAIRQGERLGSSVVVLDDEYSLQTNQLYEFAMIELVSGQSIINTVINHKTGLGHGLTAAAESKSFSQVSAQAHIRSIYAPSRKIDRMKASQIAEVLKSKGICKDTIVLAYGKNKKDLSMLRDFLESEGYGGILPSNENCYPITNTFRANIFEGVPKKQQFQLKLEHVFPMMFPPHELIGYNHEAAVDYEQTRLVWLAMEELGKPIDEREEAWRPEKITTFSQKSILDWAQPVRALGGGEEKGSSGQRKGKHAMDETTENPRSSKRLATSWGQDAKG